MKKPVLLLLLIFICINLTFAQNELTEKEKSIALCNVWGLLKYKHPEVSKGKYNWNEIFLQQIKYYEDIHTQDDLNKQLLIWIGNYSNKSIKIKTNKNDNNNVFLENENYQWITTSGFNALLIQKLTNLSLNKNFSNYYAKLNRGNFISFENEKGISNFDNSNKSHRLLFMANFWNAMNYWNVNINLTDQSWDYVLEEMTKDFLNANTVEKFELARLKIISKLNDSHANYGSKYLYSKILNKYPPFGGKIINDTLVINTVFNDSLTNLENIKIGDIITQIEGKSIKKYYQDKFSDIFSYSNSNYLKNKLERNLLILANNTDSIKVTKISSGKKNQEYLKLYSIHSILF